MDYNLKNNYDWYAIAIRKNTTTNLFFFQAVTIVQTESKSLADIDSDLAVYINQRAVRSTSSNPLLELIQNAFGPALLALQEVLDGLLESIVTAINNFKTWELYTVVAFVLSTYGISLDSLVEYVEGIQTSLDELFSYIAGSSS